MKLLITGGAGFIGTNFVYHMLRQKPDWQYVCLDALTYSGKRENLAKAEKQPKFRFVQGDIAEREAVFALFAAEHFDAVINFAAETHVDRSIASPEIFVCSNVLGTQVLLDACVQYGVPRFHQVSTDEVYGDLPLDRPELFFTEQTPLNPSSPYSASKAGADLLALAYCRTFGLAVTISRCSNNYGAYQYPEKVIPLMIAKAQKNAPLPVYGKGENVRDWLHVDDHCRALALILDGGRAGEVYNIGGHNELRNIDMIKLLLGVMNKPESLISFVADRAGHDLRYAIDPAKMQQEFGWQPEIPFAEGIVSTVAWYLDRPEWFADCP